MTPSSHSNGAANASGDASSALPLDGNTSSEASPLEADRSIVERIKAMPWQAKLFVTLAVVLLTLGLTGQFTAGNGVDLTKEEAIEIGRPEVPFEATNADARLVRQGFGLRPVWAISYSIPSADEDKDFEQHTTVEIDGGTGEIIRVITDP